MRIISISKIFSSCRVLIVDLIQISPEKMASAEALLGILLNRLTEAEKRAKLLNQEVKSIRKEISTLQQGLTDISTLQTSLNIEDTPEQTTLLKRTSTRSRSTILINAFPIDGPSKPKRSKNSTDEIDNIENNFVTENGYVVVYTDGACENNGKPNAKAGIGVWFGDNNPLNISKPVIGKATNNTAEIQACIEALQTIKDKGVQKVKIITDSQFTINCMTQWIHNWKKNSWKTASGSPVKNKIDLQKLDLIVRTFSDVKWEHVLGHKGNRGNEEADKLARQGAKLYVQ